MKKIGVFLLLFLFFVVGCGSKTKASKDDLINNLFTLKQREDARLKDGTISFANDVMEWKKVEEGQNPNTEKRDEDNVGMNTDIIKLENIQIKTEGEKYIIEGNQESKKVTLILYKQGKDQVRDEMNNVYAQ